MSIKITTWNIAWMHKMLHGMERTMLGRVLTEPKEKEILAK